MDCFSAILSTIMLLIGNLALIYQHLLTASCMLIVNRQLIPNVLLIYPRHMT